MGEASGGSQTPTKDDFVKNLALIEGRLNGNGNRLYENFTDSYLMDYERSDHSLPIRSQQYCTRFGTCSILDCLCTGDAANKRLPF